MFWFPFVLPILLCLSCADGGSDAPTSDMQPVSTQPAAAGAPAVGLQPGGPVGGSIRCLFYNEGDEAIHEYGPGERETFTLGLLEIEAFYESGFEGAAFHLRVKADGNQTLGWLFQFGNALPANQFAGGHGFTGLLYLSHPTLGGDHQAFCEAVPD